MKNRKTSYSLSKLNLRKNDFHQSSQQSFKRKHSRKTNRSQIEPVDAHNPAQNSNYEAVLNEYYGTDKQRFITSDNYDDPTQNSRRKATEKLAHGIQYKIKRLIENHEFDSDINLNNIVLEQSDVDQEFQDKIAENKYFLKEQRQKQHNFTHSQQKLHTEVNTLLDQKESKKLSILKNANEKHIRKHKTKSLLPTIGVSSSKILNLADLKYDKHRTKNNQSERKNLKQQALLPNIYQSPPVNIDDQPYPNRIESKHSLLQKQSHQFKKDEKSSKRKFTEQLMKKPDKKVAQLKLQSKIEELKNKIAQRTSAKEAKSRIVDYNVSLPQKKRHSRYSSHSVFDNIQEFLSNPHENNSKSQRKFLKLYEKIDQNEHTFNKEKEQLQKRISQIQARISTFMQEKKQQICQMQKLEQFHRPTSTGSSPIGETDSQFGALEWRRLQKEKLEKSSFEYELKYVKSLEEKGHSNLMKYIENKKMLNQLKMLKKTQEMMSKNINKDQQQINTQKYTSS